MLPIANYLIGFKMTAITTQKRDYTPEEYLELEAQAEYECLWRGDF